MAVSNPFPGITSKAATRILVVDDEPTSRSALVWLLEQDGYALHSAADGPSALRAAREHAPDVVITDLRMPGMDGIELLARLRQQDSGVLVILLSSFDDAGSAVLAMRSGAEDYLAKPVDIAALERAVERALERRRLHVEADGMRSQILAQQVRLKHLYEISKQLTRFDTIAHTLPEVLTLLNESVPLCTAVLMLEQAGPSADRTRAITWHAEGVSPVQLREAQNHARTAYTYLARRAFRIDEELAASRLPSTSPPPSLERKSGLEVRKRGFVVLPLVAEHRKTFGVLQIEGTVRLDEADLAFVNAVINQLAIALDRVAAIDSKQAAESAGRRAAEFLAEASATLFSSLEYENTIAAVLHAAVPPLADVCFLDRVADDGRLQRLTIGVAASGKANAGPIRQFELSPDCATAQDQALASGQSSVLTRLDTADDASEEYRCSAMMIVPLFARGRGLGVLTFVATDFARRYSASDLALATEIGHRAAIAIDNAQLYEKAQHAIRARQDLLASVSHDLKNPLNCILMATQLLAHSTPNEKPEDRTRRVELIQRSVQRMDRLLLDLLDIASIESGHLSVTIERHSIARLIQEVVEIHGTAAARSHLRLEERLPDAALEVDCDRDRVLQVFGNLIGNAIKFTPKAGSIRVGAERHGEEILFSVADSGAGIEPNELSHVFDRFWQARTTARLGTGLGLAIAKALVEAHAGRIWAESVIGQGATFFFTIPTSGWSARS